MRFFESHFPYGFFFKNNTSTIEDLQEENSETLAQGSARVPLAFGFWLVVLRDA
jgi:hypothetical protein